jgi:hypothetical protein
MADSKLVITVAPQKDICPHGKTYPMKAAPMVSKRRRIPENHVSINK